MKLPTITNKRVFRTLGVLMLAGSVYLLANGIAIYATPGIWQDEEEFYGAWTLQVETDSPALVLNPETMMSDGGWDKGDMKAFLVKAEAAQPDNSLFLGQATAEQVSGFLRGTACDEITGLHMNPTRVEYRTSPGENRAADPTSTDIWSPSAAGTGVQSVNWGGSSAGTTLVVMNTDGSGGLELGLQIRTQSPVALMAGSGNVIFGILTGLAGIMVISFAGRTVNPNYPEPLVHLRRQAEKQAGKTV